MGDGTIATAVRAKLGVLTNRQRFMTVRNLMKPDVFEQIVKEARPMTELKAWHRRRLYFQKQRLRVEGAMLAEVRTALGCDADEVRAGLPISAPAVPPSQ